jgi:protein phosphatase
MASIETHTKTHAIIRKPRDRDIDVFGLTHRGNVRPDNQDHFLIASLAKQMVVDRTSLPADAQLPVDPERIASLAMVADGVGSGGGGEEASRLAVLAVTQYVAQSTRAFYAADPDDPNAFTQVLCDAALRCHANLVELAERDAEQKRYATTLTLWLGLWPQAYLLQVGDSRGYMYHNGELTQISRDQTIAQELADQGILERADISTSPLSHVLSSAIGGSQAAPVVTRITRDWGTVVLLCSDGLTKHVPDHRIAERLASLTSSEQTCRELLQDALEDGGSDNVTMIIGRTIRPTDG